ncbi:MAG: hypothetical protein OXI76_03110, partial [Gemmatimonadota bacterium]|nr:hypothetical protein [Gemmatimonadota bacterium]
GVGQVTGVDRVVAGQAVGAMGYNEAPRAPREEMWGRIEAAWGMRGVGGGERRVGIEAEAGGVAGLPAEPLRAPWRWPSRRWPRRQRVAGWAAALAAAASLVLGLALGRGARETQPGEVGADPVVATVPVATADPPLAGAETPQPVQPAEPEPPVHTASIVPLPGAPVDQQAPAIQAELEPQTVGFAEATLTDVTEPARALPSSLAFRRDREQLRFFGRAETLLTALRTDQRTPLTERDLAAWGRELLVETRMHLDLHELRVPTEFALLEDRKLLEDLELVMLQISRLGSGATDVEWQLARESIQIKNALPRLRAATDADGL